MDLIHKIASSAVLDEAFGWLCQQRKDYSHNNDVWDLRRNWPIEKPRIQAQLSSGNYAFQPLRELRIDGQIIELWSSRDALVLKAMAIVLGAHLDPVVSSRVIRGISLGCSLSPLMGALYLSPLDRAMEDSGFFNARFMDDWLILAPTRWKLRNAVRAVRQVLHALKVEMHPDKTFIGRADRGFDFLGYHFEPGELTVSSAAIQRFTERISRLYEQGATEVRVGRYVQRWIQWVSAGLNRIVPTNDEIRPIGSVGMLQWRGWCGLR